MAKVSFLAKAWDTIDDFILELARTALLGAYSSVFALLLARFELLKGTEWEVVAIVGGLLLKSVDRYLHEKGIAKKGIARF